MADLDLGFYEAVEASSEVMNRPNKTLFVNGQASFLGLVLNLRIPILGSGSSFAVERFVDEFSVHFDKDFVNLVADDWFKSNKIESSRQTKFQYVAKKIVTSRDAQVTEAQQLASIVNEARILSNKSLRKSRNIVTLLGVSWFERPDQGRYWPQLLVEAAEHGTLQQYVRSKVLNFQTKTLLGLDILCGLNYLHIHDIVHCDLKPSNILVFLDRDPEHGASSDYGVENVVAKICDFGSAVILSDYNTESPFQARVGTLPWMAPEMELALPIDHGTLFKADIYSFGLVMASVWMNGLTPFDGLHADDITAIKLAELSAYHTIDADMRAKANMTSLQQALASKLLIQTLAANPDHRFDLEAIMMHMKFAVLVASMYQGPADDQQKLLELSSEDETKYISHSQTTWSSRIWSNIKTYTSEVQNKLQGLRDRSHENAIYDSIMRKRYVEPEPILQLERLSIGGTSSMGNGRIDKGDLTRVTGEVKRENDTLKTVPDFCFEIGFRPGLIPAVGAKEIIQDLHRQAEAENCSSKILYELSGCYFNGSMTKHDPELGLQFFKRAVEGHHPQATAYAYNVYQSCDETLPAGIAHIARETINAQAPSLTILVLVEVLAAKIPWNIDDDQITIESWRRLSPERHYNFSSSRKKTVQLAEMLEILNIYNQQSATCGSVKIFPFHTLPSLRGAQRYSPLSELDPEEFVKDLKAFKCCELVNDEGFTLLQRAVTHKDDEMVELLLRKLAANSENCGNTRGWTPLWLACLLGYFDIALMLANHGAKLSCVDNVSGITVLHMLNRFKHRRQIEVILLKALSDSHDGLHIEQSTKIGMTPLHMTFVGMDESRGAAARVLLEHGANPTASAPDGMDVMTPIGLCMSKLDYSLLRAMLSCPWVSTQHRDRAGISRLISESKAQAYRFLLGYTEFHFRCAVGKDWQRALNSVLALIIDDDMRRAHGESSLVLGGVDVLETALQIPRPLIAKPLIDIFALYEGVTIHNRPHIHIAIERRIDDVIMAFIENGADLLAMDGRQQTSLHVAAHYYPACLMKLVEEVDALSQEERGGKTMQEILTMANIHGFDVIGLLLVEGYEDEWQIAKELRCTYDLDLDTRPEDAIGLKYSLTGRLVGLVVVSALIPSSQVQHLLDMDPRPNFVCGDKGATLLTTAVSGRMAHQSSLSYPGHQICKMILERYPDPRNLTLGEEDTGAIHRAAMWANHIALDMIYQHIQDHNRRNPGSQVMFSQLANVKAAQGHTALDYVAGSFKDRSDEAKPVDEDYFHPYVREVRRPAAIKCYQHLRAYGVMHKAELNGLRLR
ncbi:hypothetical protein UCRPC4_g06382 [Phaeomoniella chlamydospora]|uniref:Protein kinase domain-containing protein n=1 Tax=Phaeomoniella chlamydospora TaxID=158046 RepID=A0A0G2GE55_PHACM|nr:hypothetical protein UCRPC4_g06382 [Phaeomoniella chlamydospora]